MRRYQTDDDQQPTHAARIRSTDPKKRSFSGPHHEFHEDSLRVEAPLNLGIVSRPSPGATASAAHSVTTTVRSTSTLRGSAPGNRQVPGKLGLDVDSHGSPSPSIEFAEPLDLPYTRTRRRSNASAGTDVDKIVLASRE